MCPPTCHETQGEVQLLLRRRSGGERLPGRPQGAAAHMLFSARMESGGGGGRRRRRWTYRDGNAMRA